MHNKNIKLLINGMIVFFLILMTMVSFEKERNAAKNAGEYTNAQLNAEIISHTALSTVRRAQTYQIYITVENIGETIWSDKDNIALCIWQDDVDCGFRARILDGMQIQKGEKYIFLVDGFSMPDKEKTILEFQMVKEGYTYFGEREAIEIVAVD